MKIKGLILIVLCLILFFGVLFKWVVPHSLAAKAEEELRKVKGKIHQEENVLKKIRQKKTTILGSLEELDRTIAHSEKRYRDSQKQVRTVAGDIRSLKKELASLESRILKQEKSNAGRIVAYYRIGKSGILPVLFSVSSLPEKLNNLNAMKVVLDADWKRLESFRSLLKQKESAEEKLQARLAREKKLKKEMKRHVKEEKEKRRDKDGLLFRMGQDEHLHKGLLEELRNSEKELERMFREREEQQVGEYNKRGESTNGSLTSGKGKLHWPVVGQLYRKYGKTFDPLHQTTIVNRGIDIRTKMGEPVRAVWGGEVAYADWFRGYGKLLIVHHGSKDYTVLSHMSRLTKGEKERVEPGEIVGYAGDTGSMEGCMVHFEVWHEGKPRNPMEWIRKIR